MMRHVLVAALAVSACSPTTSTTGNPPCTLPSGLQAAVDRYADGVHAEYSRTVTAAEALKAAVDALIATPSQASLDAARSAWLTARTPYGETEAFRFYGGPIDDDTDGVEGRVNAWPMDEAYVDYVEGNASAGIINDPSKMLTEENLISLNEQGGEDNIATGWHAIEFLLWGQDKSATGPGARPVADFIDGTNAARRKEYLAIVTNLLVRDLTTVRDAWAPNVAGNYRASFVADGHGALAKILRGMGALGGAELSGERMSVAYEEKDQEDEHSCFSDNTHNDLVANARSIENVWLGRYAGMTSGTAIRDLVAEKDAALAARLTTEIADSVTKVSAIPAPFDQAILGSDDSAGRLAVRAGIEALRKQTDTLVEAANALCTPVSVEVE